MYSRAPRTTNLVRSQTIPDVNPTTYIIPDARDERVNTVPFLSTANRLPVCQKNVCDVYYDIPPSVKPTTGGSTPRDKAPRFIYKVADHFSSRDYEEIQEYLRKRKGKSEKTVPSKIRPKKLYVCRVPYSVKGSAPAIPIDSLGYKLTSNQSLIKILPKRKDLTLGPAYYHVPYETFSANKGCKWSSRTGQRSTYNVEPGPGPDAYDVMLPKCYIREGEEEFREMARRLSFVPRYLESREMRLKKENLPGPGQYDILNHNICNICPSVKPRPFINSSKRFETIVSENPAPGEYNMDTVKYPVSKKQTPFSVESARFTKKQVSDSPGPAYYDVPSPLIEKLIKKKNQYASFEVPFNNTAKRNTLGINRDAAFMPSPADYYQEGQGHCKILVSSVFKSKTIRFKKICSKNEISPASYNITNAFESISNKISHHAFEVSFNTTSKRKGIIPETEGPGPADYCTRNDLSSKGHIIPVTGRVDQISVTPGPGTYYIHPLYDQSLYKASKTFNLHIKESVLRKKLRRSPKETWAKWAANLKRKKKMKWFAF